MILVFIIFIGLIWNIIRSIRSILAFNFLIWINIPKSDFFDIIIEIILFSKLLIMREFLISICLHQYLLWKCYFFLKLLVLLRRCMEFVWFLFLKIFTIFISHVFFELLFTIKILDILLFFLSVKLGDNNLISFFRTVVFRRLITHLYLWPLIMTVVDLLIQIITLLLIFLLVQEIRMINFTIILFYLILFSLILSLDNLFNTVILYWICNMRFLPFLSNQLFANGALSLLW